LGGLDDRLRGEGKNYREFHGGEREEWTKLRKWGKGKKKASQKKMRKKRGEPKGPPLVGDLFGTENREIIPAR